MQKLLFIIQKGFEKSGGATRAFQFAALAAEQGSEVDVFLVDDASHWGQAGMAEGVYSSTGEHMKDLIERLLARRAQIHVCKACLDRRLISPNDLIEGVRIGTASDLVALLINPLYKVITF